MFRITEISSQTQHNRIKLSIGILSILKSIHSVNTMPLSQMTLEELFGQVMFSSVVTRHDRRQLRSVLLERTLNEDEYAIINRLLYNVRRGWVKIID